MKDLLKKGFDELGIMWDEDKIQKLLDYKELLLRWNEKINLTAITEAEEICIKHFLDSAAALSSGRISGRVIDVGTGAGFPGLVLKIMKPQIQLTLLDSLNKRLVFLEDVIKNLGIEGVRLVHSRAEDAAHNKDHREKYDVAVSRAVAQLPLLSELCLAYVKIGGDFIALKGPTAFDEAKQAKRAVGILGGEIECVQDAFVPFKDLDHKLVIIKKVRHTPMKFPRKPALISKNPIETCYNIPKKPTK